MAGIGKGDKHVQENRLDSTLGSGSKVRVTQNARFHQTRSTRTNLDVSPDFQVVLSLQEDYYSCALAQWRILAT